MMKIGLYGGTFDPVHLAHVSLVMAALREAGLDRLLVIPAADPPHKAGSGITPYEHRVAMVEIALAGCKKVEVSRIEDELPRPSFTIDTVKELQKRSTRKTEQDEIEKFYFIIGSDAFCDIVSWKAYNELLCRVSLVVAQRKGEKAVAENRALREKLGYAAGDSCWIHPQGTMRDIFFISADIPHYSSSEIRDILQNDRQNIEGVPEEVLAYIERHNLYCA